MVRPLVVLSLVSVLTAAGAASTAAQVKPKAPAPRKTPAAKPATPTAEASKPEPPKPEPPATDVRLKTAFTQGAQVSQNVTYIKGARQRVEFTGVVALDQCDLKRSVMLNPTAKLYRLQPYPEAAPAPPAHTPADSQAAQPAPPISMASALQGMRGGGSGAPAARGGVVTMTTTLSDTLERKTMLGLEARRIKTVVVKQFTPNACDKSPLKVEIDAWYVDLPAQAACTHAAAPVAAPPPATDPAACTDHVETRVVGDVKLGFPLQTVTTTTTGEGDKVDVTTTSQEVTELEITRLDKALFEVPADYTEAKSSAEIAPALASGGSLSDVLFGSTVDGSSAAAPKKAGTIRVGILEPINKTTRTLPAGALRQELVGQFHKAPYEALPVAGTSAAAVEQEAARLQCDYLLATEITEVKTSKPGKLGGVMKMAGGGPQKDSQEVKLDYKLFAVGATQTPKVSGNAKASNGGFGVGSALRIAAFAGQMYMGMGMMGGMMGGMGLGMNPMMGLSRMGGLGSMSGALFDPRAMAMNSMASGLMNGMSSATGSLQSGDPSEAEMRQTVSEALSNEAKTAIDALGKKK
jgi:hypothetical protein